MWYNPSALEGSHSGLVHNPGKVEYPQGYQEFESPPLRKLDNKVKRLIGGVLIGLGLVFFVADILFISRAAMAEAVVVTDNGGFGTSKGASLRYVVVQFENSATGKRDLIRSRVLVLPLVLQARLVEGDRLSIFYDPNYPHKVALDSALSIFWRVLPYFLIGSVFLKREKRTRGKTGLPSFPK